MSCRNQSVNIPKTSSFLSTDCRKIQLFYKPNNLRKRFVRYPLLQTASRRRSQILQMSPRDIQTIQCVNVLCKAVNNRLFNQPERDTRIWYHKTAAFKECPQAPFLYFHAPILPPLARLADFSFRPIPHLGACSQAMYILHYWLKN